MPSVDQICVAARAHLGPGPDVGKFTNVFLRPHLAKALADLNANLSRMGITAPAAERWAILSTGYDKLNLTSIGLVDTSMITRVDYRTNPTTLQSSSVSFTNADPSAVASLVTPEVFLRVTFTAPHELSTGQRAVIYRVNGTTFPIEGEFPIRIQDPNTIDLLGCAGALKDPLVPVQVQISPVRSQLYQLFPISRVQAEQRVQSSAPSGFHLTTRDLLVPPSNQPIQLKISYQPTLGINDQLPDDQILVGYPGSEGFLSHATAGWAALPTAHALAGTLLDGAYGSTSGTYTKLKTSQLMEALNRAIVQGVSSGQIPIDSLEPFPRKWHL